MNTVLAEMHKEHLARRLRMGFKPDHVIRIEAEQKQAAAVASANLAARAAAEKIKAAERAIRIANIAKSELLSRRAARVRSWDKMIALMILEQEKGTQPSVALMRSREYKKITLSAGEAKIEAIKLEISDRSGYSFYELNSARRNKDLCKYKFELYYRARNETNLSFPQIGMLCGGRDHTTIMNGAKKYAEMRENDNQ